MSNEIRVLKVFIEEFSPIHQGMLDKCSYSELVDIVKEIIQDM